MKKTSNALLYLYAFLLSGAIMLVCVAVLAFILLKSKAGNSLVGAAAALSAFVSALSGGIYAGKATKNPYGALIAGGILLSVLVCISLGMGKSEYSIPFAVPIGCLAGGVLPFFALSKTKTDSSKQVKKLVKRRRRLS